MHILCYAPFSNYHPIHGYWELTLLHGLALRGAKITYVLCGFEHCICDLFRTFPSACSVCHAKSSFIADQMRMSYKWLSDYSYSDDFEKSLKWLEGLNPIEYRNAVYEGINIGNDVFSSFLYHLRAPDYDFRNPEHVTIYAYFLVSGMRQAFALRRLLKSDKFDRIVHYNGRFSFSKILSDIAWQQDIKIYTHERGHIQDTILVSLPDKEWSGHPSHKYTPKAWIDVPLSKEELEKTYAVLMGREHGDEKCLGWVRYSPQSTALNVRNMLGIEPERRIWTFFTSAEDELRPFPEYYGEIGDQLECIIYIIKHIEKFSNVHFIIRMHPHSQMDETTGVEKIYTMASLLKEKYSFITVVGPDDRISTYDIIRCSELGMSMCSTCGLEMAGRGKPFISLGKWFARTDAMYFATSLPELKESLNAFHERRIPVDPVRIQRFALRYWHFTNFVVSQPFPLVKQSSPTEALPAYRNLNALRRGKDATLDFICDRILAGKIPYREPDAEHLARTEAEEDAWLVGRQQA